MFTNDNTDGSDGPITITDQFTHDPAAGIVTYDEDNIVITHFYDEITDYEIVYHQQTGDDRTGSFTITGLPALGPNEPYEIYYVVKPDLDSINSQNG